MGVVIQKHSTTMTPHQRAELIRILSVPLMEHDLTKLACMTDEELHEQWIIDCDYPNPYK